MSPDVVRNLYSITPNRSFIWIDDAFVSGILANDLKIQHFNLKKHFQNVNDDYIDQWLHYEKSILPPIFSLLHRDINQMINIWNKTVQYYRSNLNITF